MGIVMVLGVPVVWWFCFGRSYGYPIKVSRFTSQADKIKKGMTEDDVLRIVVQRTAKTYSPDRRTLYFSLEAEPNALIPRTTIYIRVGFSESGRVEEVIVYDGTPVRGMFW